MEVLIKLIQRDDIVKRNLSVNILYNLICRNYQNKGKIWLYLFEYLDKYVERIRAHLIEIFNFTNLSYTGGTLSAKPLSAKKTT